MKKLQLSALVIIMSIFGLNGCNTHTEQSPEPQDALARNYKVPEVLYGATVGGIRLPDGTTTTFENGGSTVRFIYPKGIRYVSSQSRRTDFSSLSPIDGSYTCTGSCSSGCDVYYVQGSFACSACGNGAACTGKGSGLMADDGGFVDIEAGISFLGTKAEAQALEKINLQAPRDLFEFEYVRAAMRRLNQEVHGEADPTLAIARNPEKYRHVAINMFGVLVDYTVPISYLEKVVVTQNKTTKASGIAAQQAQATIKTLFVMADPIDGGFSCSCSSGGSGCTAESGLGYKKCNSGECKSCTMSVG